MASTPLMGAKLRLLRKGRGRDQAEVARAIGVSPNTIWRLENIATNATLSILSKLSTYYDVELSYLTDDVRSLDELFIPSSVQETISSSAQTHTLPLASLPIVDISQLPHERRALYAYVQMKKEVLMLPLNHGPHAFAFQMPDESMVPRINNGDWVIVDPDMDEHSSAGADCVALVAVTKDGTVQSPLSSAQVRIMHRLDDSSVMLTGGTGIKPVVVAAENVAIIGIVLKIFSEREP